MSKLADKSFWSSILNGVGFIATGASTVVDTHLAGYIGMGFMALTGPVGKVIATTVESITSNYANTASPVDDIVHAAAEAVAEK